MIPSPVTLETIAASWDAIRTRYGAYALAMPGVPAFHCQPQLCDAHCCRAFTVNLGEAEVRRMHTTSGLAPSRFLESENGEPLALPLAQPYILARRDNHCALLDDSLGCGQYAGRPNACRLYPHFLLFFDRALQRPVHGDVGAIRHSIARLLAGQPFDVLVPMLVRHVECPGFTGEPMTPEQWIALVAETFELQFPSN
ncbi:MAG TPA: YkgJ family cysteine cluster protein [Tepidiformaceae bacterium]|nr:YkgJ family cysteine cluster protein [Tepidiformaceae bacterium]